MRELYPYIVAVAQWMAVTAYRHKVLFNRDGGMVSLGVVDQAMMQFLPWHHVAVFAHRTALLEDDGAKFGNASEFHKLG